MTAGNDPSYGEDVEMGRALRALPRYPASARLRSALVETLAPAPPRRRWAFSWLTPAASALATALIMLLWLAPSLPPTTPPDPLRPFTRGVIDDHARTILWGQTRPEQLETILPQVMDESRVSLTSLFTRDDRIQLMDAKPTYLEGRLGIELAYKDIDGHFVSYVVLPAPALVLPERGRVQIDRWRPLVRKENGFTMILWKQQGLLCVMISDLVSDEDF